MAGTGWPCDRRSGILPVGDDLVFAYEGALYLAKPGGEPTVLVDFGSRIAKEITLDEATGEEIVASWQVENVIVDLRAGPAGAAGPPAGILIAFRLVRLEVPLEKESPSEYTESDIAGFTGPAGGTAALDGLYVDEGAYVIDVNTGSQSYIMPTSAVYCFLDDGRLALEYGLTLCSADIQNPSEARPPGFPARPPVLPATVVVPDDYFELGWTPAAASGGGTDVVLCNKAKPGSDVIVLNNLYVLEDGRLPASPAVTIESRERAARVVVSPDGRYAALDVPAGLLGGSSLYIADLETGAFDLLAENGSAYTFLPSSSGLVYYADGGAAGRGDLWAVGLDGSGLRRVTDTGDVFPPP